MEIGRKKNKIKFRRPKGGGSILNLQAKRKVEQRRKEESGACMQPHVRDGIVYLGKLTQKRGM